MFSEGCSKLFGCWLPIFRLSWGPDPAEANPWLKVFQCVFLSRCFYCAGSVWNNCHNKKMKPLSIRHFPDCVGRSKSVFSINSGKISDTTDWNAAPNQTKPPACFTHVDTQSCSSLLTSSAHINNNLNQKVKIIKENQGIEVYHSGDYSYDENYRNVLETLDSSILSCSPGLQDQQSMQKFPNLFKLLKSQLKGRVLVLPWICLKLLT